MKKELKKEIFLLILESIFGDKTREIDKKNCISFYHFLVNTLLDEIQEIPPHEEEDIYLCSSIIELLCNFDIMGDGLEDWEGDMTIDFLRDFSGLSDTEFDSTIIKFRKIYILIKDDFLLDLM